MKMTRCSAAILLMLSLGGLVAGRFSAVIADGGIDTIRLPNQVSAAERPCKCCNLPACTKGRPQICRCTDEARQCDAACKACVPSTSNPGLFVCNDKYAGHPGPICRPWDCCDRALCTRSIPPNCRCTDQVNACASTCKDCSESTSDPYRYVCKDPYRGFPGPNCTDTAAGGGGN